MTTWFRYGGSKPIPVDVGDDVISVPPHSVFEVRSSTPQVSRLYKRGLLRRVGPPTGDTLVVFRVPEESEVKDPETNAAPEPSKFASSLTELGRASAADLASKPANSSEPKKASTKASRAKKSPKKASKKSPEKASKKAPKSDEKGD